MIEYCEFYPAAPLRDFIKCYWLLSSNEKNVRISDRILPCGCIDILFQKERSLLAHLSPGGVGLLLPQFIIGPQFTEGFILSMMGKVKIFGIRIHSHAAKSFFGFPVTELNQSIWPVDEILSSDYYSVAEQVVNAFLIEESLELLNDFFMKKVSSFSIPDPAIKNICFDIIKNKGDKRLKEIFMGYNETEQTLRARFLKQVGLWPKDFLRISRFLHAVSLDNVISCKKKSLTDIALSAGYYDQAHFIRDFREITGMSPGQYFKSERPITAFFTSPAHISFPLNLPDK